MVCNSCVSGKRASMLVFYQVSISAFYRLAHSLHWDRRRLACRERRQARLIFAKRSPHGLLALCDSQQPRRLRSQCGAANDQSATLTSSLTLVALRKRFGNLTTRAANRTNHTMPAIPESKPENIGRDRGPILY